MLDSKQFENEPLNIYKRLMVMSEFIIASDLEDRYVSYLRKMLNESDWEEFREEILSEIELYGISEEQIHHEIEKNSFIKVPLQIC